MDVFKQHVIVSVIHPNSNQNRTWRFECFAQHRADFFRGIDHAATRPKGFCVLDDIHRAEVHAGCALVFGPFLNPDHVVGSIDPDHMHEVELQPDDRLEFHGGEQESAVSGDRQGLFMGPYEARCDAPGKSYA